MAYVLLNGPMFKRRKTDAAMWINPHSSLNRGQHIAWDRRKTDGGNARYLELADVALKPRNTNPAKADTLLSSDDIEQ
jgi:hypothetical protein